MPRGPSKPKAKPAGKPKHASSRPTTAKGRVRGAAKKGGKADDGTFTSGNVLGKRKPLPPISFQELQRELTYSPQRLMRAWQLVEAHIEIGNLDAALFAIRMACGREPQSVGIQVESISPITIELPAGVEPPPWMTAPKKVPNLAAVQSPESARGGPDGQRNR